MSGATCAIFITAFTAPINANVCGAAKFPG